MIFDRTLMFSDGQPILANTSSTDNVDLAVAGDAGKGASIPLLIQVVESFAGLTSLTVTVQTSDNPAFTGTRNVATATYPLLTLRAGARFALATIPAGSVGRYMRLLYSAVGVPTAGRVTAGVMAGEPETANSF